MLTCGFKINSHDGGFTTLTNSLSSIIFCCGTSLLSAIKLRWSFQYQYLKFLDYSWLNIAGVLAWIQIAVHTILCCCMFNYLEHYVCYQFKLHKGPLGKYQKDPKRSEESDRDHKPGNVSACGTESFSHTSTLGRVLDACCCSGAWETNGLLDQPKPSPDVGATPLQVAVPNGHFMIPSKCGDACMLVLLCST